MGQRPLTDRIELEGGVLALFATAALAADSVEVRPELLTTAPLHVGGGLLFELGPRIRLTTSVGLLPRPYVQTITGVIGAFEPTFSEQDANLVRQSLQRSVVLQGAGGWRPFSKLGLYGHTGVTFVGLGGGASAADLLETLLQIEIPEDNRRRERLELLVFDGQANLLLLDVQAGWDQKLWRGLHARLGLGWSWTVSSSTTLQSSDTFDNPLVQEVVDTIEVEGAAYLDAVFAAYAHPPTATLALGWVLP